MTRKKSHKHMIHDIETKEKSYSAQTDKKKERTESVNEYDKCQNK